MQLKLRQIACEMSDCTTFAGQANRPDRRWSGAHCSTGTVIFRRFTEAA
jgi:hypothetical protein